jgi:hypothetical protein
MQNNDLGTERAAFVARHGARVRRAAAMKLLGLADKHTFQKVVDANPALRHKLIGEGQAKYLTGVIFDLLSSAARCATTGVEK